MVHDSQGAALRRRLASAPRHGVGRPYPESLRHEALHYVEQCASDGVPLATIAATLGLPEQTLRRWRTSSAPLDSPFRPVVVRPEPATTSAPFVLQAPGGLRIEVRDVESLAALLQRWPR
jgi:hypothetical protein